MPLVAFEERGNLNSVLGQKIIVTGSILLLAFAQFFMRRGRDRRPQFAVQCVGVSPEKFTQLLSLKSNFKSS
jgi:hypothetical protein